MEYEWDEVKHESNLLKHGLDFSDADLVLNIRTSLRLRVRLRRKCAGRMLLRSKASWLP
ncbi:MAG TPA: hypothetical protein EYG15_04885 [Deltaproteobacteria bacterium]|nr:hypothetical protein [Deltaproteobacteria bacterium]HBI28562.1 hypothetical protein [Deltaproteobacteria bacterium]HIF70611.1 hypothetical protein [Candidatus Lambdaproteobacteria bacterium]HIL15425.1 hypothetical protein [Deltaproteobacteria bacterium]